MPHWFVMWYLHSQLVNLGRVLGWAATGYQESRENLDQDFILFQIILKHWKKKLFFKNRGGKRLVIRGVSLCVSQTELKTAAAGFGSVIIRFCSIKAGLLQKLPRLSPVSSVKKPETLEKWSGDRDQTPALHQYGRFLGYILSLSSLPWGLGSLTGD